MKQEERVSFGMMNKTRFIIKFLCSSVKKSLFSSKAEILTTKKNKSYTESLVEIYMVY